MTAYTKRMGRRVTVGIVSNTPDRVRLQAEAQYDYDFSTTRPKVDLGFDLQQAKALRADLDAAIAKLEASQKTGYDLWGKLPLGARIRGHFSDPGDWIKLSATTYTVYDSGEVYNISLFDYELRKQALNGKAGSIDLNLVR